MIKNVIFDIGNVLVDFRWRELMVDLGFSDECIAVLTENMVHHPLWDELDMGIRPHGDIIRDMKSLSPMYAGEIDSFFGNIKDVVCLRQQAAGWLSGLKARGLGVYLLSNYPDWLFEMHSRQFDFLPYTDGLVVSSHVRMMKPTPGIYRLLLDKYSLRAEECVFIDDRPLNTQAAEDMGIRSVVYVTQEQAESELESIIAGR